MAEEDIATPISSNSHIAIVNSSMEPQEMDTATARVELSQENIEEITQPEESIQTIKHPSTTVEDELQAAISVEFTEVSNSLALMEETNNKTQSSDRDNTVISPVKESPLVPIPFPTSPKSLQSGTTTHGMSNLLDGSYLNASANLAESAAIPNKSKNSSNSKSSEEQHQKNVMSTVGFDLLEKIVINNGDVNDIETKKSPDLVENLNDSKNKTTNSKPKWQLCSSEIFLEPENLVKINKNVSIGLDNLPEQRLDRVIKKENKKISYTSKTSSNNLFNLMVVGQQGLGKSTFVNTLFQAHILDSGVDKANLYFKDDAEKRIFTEFADPLKEGCSKTTKIEKTYVLLEEENVSLKLCIIDTPGFGDYSDNSFSWVPICEYIDSNFTQFMFNEEQPFRDLQVDARVHCCLYFISPSNKGLSPLDIVSMQEISKRVNLIPVIAKSDGLTLDELSNFKMQIKEIISKQDIKICDLLLKDQEQLGVSVDYPFAIIGGTYHSEKKKFGREYKHGFVDVMEEKYSDFTKISNFIIKENMIDLIHSTNLYYEIWRDKLLAFRFKKIADLLANIDENKLDDEENDDPIKKLLVPNIDEASVCKIGISGKTLSELNLEDDIDSNGLDNYKVYSIINKMHLNRHMLDWDPIFIHKQWDLKKSFNDLVSTQEKKFKEWKRTLFNKQNKFNDEIDVLHSRVKMLQKECLKIEQTIKYHQQEKQNLKMQQKKQHNISGSGIMH